MATWEDGPEYAPLERPDDFTVPDASPLVDPPPVAGPPAAPVVRPQFGDPETPVAPLSALVPRATEEHRDPQTPYRVDTATMTDGGAWGAAHWRSPSTVPAGPGTDRPAGSAPAGTPATQAVTLQSGPAGSDSNFPAPGTPGWFGPGPPQPHPPEPPPTLGKATPILAIIALACAIFYVTAPFAFLAGFLLCLPAKYAKRQLMITWAVVGGAILLISTMSTLSNYGDLSDWYGVLRSWSLLASLLMIILILVIVYHDINQNPPSAPPGTPGRSAGGYLAPPQANHPAQEPPRGYPPQPPRPGNPPGSGHVDPPRSP